MGLGNVGFAYDDQGQVGTTLSHAGSLIAHPGFELLYGIDTDESRRRAFMESTGIPAFSSVPEAREGPPVDLVIVATPTETHFQAMNEALTLSPQCILLEKPVASTAAEAALMIRRAQEAKVDIFVNFMRAADEGIKELQVFASRVLGGDQCRGYFVYTGSLLNSGSHGIHLLRTLLGRIQGGYLVYERSTDQDVREPVGGLVHFPSAEVALSPLSFVPYETHQIHLWGSRGQLSVAGRLSHAEYRPWTWDGTFKGSRVLGSSTVEWHMQEDSYQLRVLDQITDHFNGQSIALCTLREAVELQIELDGLQDIIL